MRQTFPFFEGVPFVLTLPQPSDKICMTQIRLLKRRHSLFLLASRTLAPAMARAWILIATLDSVITCVAKDCSYGLTLALMHKKRNHQKTIFFSKIYCQVNIGQCSILALCLKWRLVSVLNPIDIQFRVAFSGRPLREVTGSSGIIAGGRSSSGAPWRWDTFHLRSTF